MHPSRTRATCLALLFYLGAGALAFAENAEPAAPAKKVNINTASSTELTYLPRIGAKVAERILARRKEKPFSRPEDLMEVKGIGEKLFVTLKPYVSVSGPTTLNAKIRLFSSSRRSSSPSAAKEKPASAVPVGKGR